MRPHLVRAVLVLGALAPSALAQVPLSGALSDATTGPLLAGTVYHASGSLDVVGPLTIEAGVVVKLVPGAAVSVNSTLNVQGTAQAPVVLTDIKDDSAGGDTNGDGPSSGVAGEWTYVRFFPGSGASVCEHLEVRYAGRNGWAGVTLSGASPTLRDSVVRDCAAHGLSATTESPVVERCRFEDNAGVAVDCASFANVAGFLDCSASGNGGDYQRVPGHGVQGAVTVSADDLIGGAVVLTGGVTVGAGTSLRLGPGVVVKGGPTAAFEVTGTLETLGGAAAPVVLTSLRDDSVAGDTNGDGPSAGAPGDWTYVRFYAGSDAGVLEHTEVRFAGRAGWGGIVASGGRPAVRDSVIRDGAAEGVQHFAVATPTFARCRFEGNAGRACALGRLEHFEAYSGCAASGNLGGDFQHFAGAALQSAATIGVDNLLGAVFVASAIHVDFGGHLTLGPGVVLKLTPGGSIEANGRIDLAGELGEPVVVTSFRDDSICGDTNLDGPSTGAPGDWVYVRLYTNGASGALRHALLRFGGANGWATLRLEGDGHGLEHVRIDYSAAGGFELFRHAGPVARGLTAWRCGATGIALGADGPDLARCTAAGCGTGFSKPPTSIAFVTDSIVHGSSSSAGGGFNPGEWRYSNGMPSTAGALGNLMADPLFVDAGNGDLRLQPQSPCIDAGDPSSPPDSDGSRADMGAYEFDHGRPTVACVQASAGPCGAWLSHSNGHASVSGASQLVVTLHSAPTNTAGIFFYGVSTAPVAVPPVGTVCALPHFVRAAAFASGGDPAVGPCEGRFDFDVTAFLATPAGAGLAPGTAITGQFWYRDPLSGITRFSDGLRIPIRP